MIRQAKAGFPVAVAGAMLIVLGGDIARAGCVNKAAEATAGNEKSAKWYVLETMVQSVSWGLWPSFVANGTTPGWKIRRQRYRCRPAGGMVTCRGQATFCETRPR